MSCQEKLESIALRSKHASSRHTLSVSEIVSEIRIAYTTRCKGIINLYAEELPSRQMEG